MNRWEIVGGVRRKGDGIMVTLDPPLAPHEIVIGARYVEDVFHGTCVPVYALAETGPNRCGVAMLSRAKTMIRLMIPGLKTHSPPQIITAHIRAHFQRADPREVEVMLPPRTSAEGRSGP